MTDWCLLREIFFPVMYELSFGFEISALLGCYERRMVVTDVWIPSSTTHLCCITSQKSANLVYIVVEA